jgi:sec-independent protein translocase protein TatC
MSGKDPADADGREEFGDVLAFPSWDGGESALDGIGREKEAESASAHGDRNLPAAAGDNAEEGAGQGKSMSLMDHLHELRGRLIRVLIVIGLGFFACYAVSDRLFAELVKPLVAVMPQGAKLIFTSLPEAFFVYMKVAFTASVFLTSPYAFYQIWAFVAPGLYEEEQRFVLPLAGFSAFFFLAGASFCYFAVFPLAFDFFMGFATDTIIPMPSLDEYLGFTLKLLIAFGLIFEMPLFAFFLARLGILTPQILRAWRRYAVVAIFIVAAVLTPPDVASQILMAAPMLLLYEISILIAAAAQKRRHGKKTEEHLRPEAGSAGGAVPDKEPV